VHHPPDLVTLDEARVLQDAEVLEEAGQRHVERFGQLAYRRVAFAQPDEHGAARRVGQRAEHRVESPQMVNHKVNYAPRPAKLSSESSSELARAAAGGACLEAHEQHKPWAGEAVPRSVRFAI